ncbi:MAG: hypothetical protein AAB381_02530 [Patescibacteria group bacterium]
MNTSSNQNPITLDDLALMVNKGFKESARDLAEFRAETRLEFKKIDLLLKHHDVELPDHEHRISRTENQLQIA